LLELLAIEKENQTDCGLGKDSPPRRKTNAADQVKIEETGA